MSQEENVEGWGDAEGRGAVGAGRRRKGEEEEGMRERGEGLGW